MSDAVELGGAARQALTAVAFVELVDTLVGDFDVIDVLTGLTGRCVELLGAAAAGVLLADAEGTLRVIGASSEQINLLELFQVQNQQGPCLDAYTTGRIVINADMRHGSPWPSFSAECTAAGFPSVCAIPLRLKSVTLGCLNLFMSEPVALSEADVSLARALADVASIAIVQDQAMRESAIREGQLQHALQSRIAIEQAKGMIAERAQLDMNEAFQRLRTYARNNNRGLTAVAESIAAGVLTVDALELPPSPASGSRP